MAPASSTPVAPPPTMTKVSSAMRSAGSVSRSARSKDEQNAAADRGGVLQGLEAGREWLPFIMTEVGVPCAGRQHQGVIAHGMPVGERQLALRGVDAVDHAEQGRHLLAPAQQMADRPCDLGSRERRRTDLVQERLKKMMVALIDDGDAHRRAGESVGDAQAGEARAGDHDVVWLRCMHMRRCY